MVQLKQQRGSEEGFPEPTRGNVCSVSRQPQHPCLPPLQGRGVMRTCTTLLGSDRTLRNPRAGMSWGWREAGAYLCVTHGLPPPPPAEHGCSAPTTTGLGGRKAPGNPGHQQGRGKSALAPLPTTEQGQQMPPWAGTQHHVWSPQSRSSSGALRPTAEGTGQMCWRGLPLLL